VRVGIAPAHQLRARARLWAALRDAYPVRFMGCEPGATRGLDAIVAFDDVETPAIGVPRLTLHGEEASCASLRGLSLATAPILARPLRGARLTDGYAGALERVEGNEIVLATLDGAPAWTDRRVACAPAELGAGEALRERLRPGRCLALLAMAHFLADITTHLRPPAPPLRAAFLIDDPNLRRPRYGHLDYAALLHEARLHGYHLAVAMVPLDARLAHGRAIRIFREGAAHLSLCIHGNNHDGPELGRPRTEAQATAILGQALRRVASFERRTGIAVDRVMVPPHERLSEPAARALRACGFAALATTRPYPWVADTPEQFWLKRPPEIGPLAAWRPVDVVAGGLPVLLRANFERHPREDLILRAFLGQPLILYGHHDLLAEGPGALARAAAQIDRLGEVRWSSLASIARAHAPTRSPMQEHFREGSPAGDLREDQLLDPCVRGAMAAKRYPARAPSGRLTPLLRRLASEGRDRAAAIAAR
jgi:hypothetical protein